MVENKEPRFNQKDYDELEKALAEGDADAQKEAETFIPESELDMDDAQKLQETSVDEGPTEHGEIKIYQPEKPAEKPKPKPKKAA